MTKPTLLLPSSLLAALLLIPMGTGGSAHACSLDGARLTHTESECLKLLRTLRDPMAPGPQRVAEQLEGLGRGALGTLFATLETRQVPDPADLEGKAQVLSEPQTEAVLAALDRIGRGSALPVWQERYGEYLVDTEEEAKEVNVSSVPIRAAVQALGGFGGSEELELIWQLLGMDEQLKEKLPRSLKLGLTSAVEGILGRDEQALSRLQREWDDLPDAWVDPVIRAIGRTRDPRGNQLLLDLIQFSSSHSRLAVSQVQLLGPTNDRRLNEELSGTLLGQFGSESQADVQAAILAVGVLEDETAIPALIDLFEDERAGVQGNVAHALKQMTTLSFNPSAQVWRMWHAEELKWVRNERPAVLRQLTSSDANVVKTALREIVRHRLGRHEMARAVGDLMVDNNVSVKLEAARVLGELQSRWGANALIDGLRDPSEAVRDASHGALKKITGLELSPSPEEWEALDLP